MSNSREVALVQWLRANQVESVAMTLLEGLRPFCWLLGQVLLVAQPFAPDAVSDAVQWLEQPDALDSLVGQLAEGTPQ